jgi:hypothetical protein
MTANSSMSACFAKEIELALPNGNALHDAADQRRQRNDFADYNRARERSVHGRLGQRLELPDPQARAGLAGTGDDGRRSRTQPSAPDQPLCESIARGEAHQHHQRCRTRSKAVDHRRVTGLGVPGHDGDAGADASMGHRNSRQRRRSNR